MSSTRKAGMAGSPGECVDVVDCRPSQHWKVKRWLHPGSACVAKAWPGPQAHAWAERPVRHRKGDAVDCMLAVLRQHGVRHALAATASLALVGTPRAQGYDRPRDGFWSARSGAG